MSDNQNNNENILYLEAQLEKYPALRERILRAFLISLHSSNIVSVDEMYEQARNQAQQRVDIAGTAQSRDQNLHLSPHPISTKVTPALASGWVETSPSAAALDRIMP